jgi:hypothetical protein
LTWTVANELEHGIIGEPRLDHWLSRPSYQLDIEQVNPSDESEPSWLEPELVLKDFQLGSDRLVTFFPSARNRKSDENEPKF